LGSGKGSFIRKTKNKKRSN